jgi:hypothetical protein
LIRSYEAGTSSSTVFSREAPKLKYRSTDGRKDAGSGLLVVSLTCVKEIQQHVKKMKKSIYQLAIAALFLAVGVKANESNGKTIQIQNESGRPCELYWIDTSSGEAHPMKVDPPLDGGGEMMQLNSYAGHVFECREAPNVDTGTCDNSDKQCSIARITVPGDFPEGAGK